MKLDLREIPAIYMNMEHHVEKSENMKNMLMDYGMLGFRNIKAGISLAYLFKSMFVRITLDTT